MRNLLITLCLLLSSVGMLAQKTIDNDFLSMKVPSDWQCIDLPMMYEDTIGNVKSITLINRADKDNLNMGVVIVYEKQLDLNFLFGEDEIKSRLKINDVTMNLGEMYSTTFYGQEAKARKYTMSKEGMATTASGVVYVAYVNNYSVYIMEMSTQNTKADFGKLWQTIKWKEYVKKEIGASDPYEGELKSAISVFNTIVEMMPAQNGQKMLGMDLNTSSKTITYKMRFTDVSMDDIPKENLTQFRNEFKKEDGPEFVKNLTSVDNYDFLKEAMDKGYKFKIMVFDKDDKCLIIYNHDSKN